MLIERILVLIRNVLQVPANPELECRADNDASVHDQVIWALHQSGILDLVLFVISSPDEHQFHLHGLEILCLLYREQVSDRIRCKSFRLGVIAFCCKRCVILEPEKYFVYFRKKKEIKIWSKLNLMAFPLHFEHRMHEPRMHFCILAILWLQKKQLEVRMVLIKIYFIHSSTFKKFLANFQSYYYFSTWSPFFVNVVYVPFSIFSTFCDFDFFLIFCKIFRPLQRYLNSTTFFFFDFQLFQYFLTISKILRLFNLFNFFDIFRLLHNFSGFATFFDYFTFFEFSSYFGFSNIFRLLQNFLISSMFFNIVCVHA